MSSVLLNKNYNQPSFGMRFEFESVGKNFYKGSKHGIDQIIGEQGVKKLKLGERMANLADIEPDLTVYVRGDKNSAWHKDCPVSIAISKNVPEVGEIEGTKYARSMSAADLIKESELCLKALAHDAIAMLKENNATDEQLNAMRGIVPKSKMRTAWKSFWNWITGKKPQQAIPQITKEFLSTLPDEELEKIARLCDQITTERSLKGDELAEKFRLAYGDNATPDSVIEEASTPRKTSPL